MLIESGGLRKPIETSLADLERLIKDSNPNLCEHDFESVSNRPEYDVGGAVLAYGEREWADMMMELRDTMGFFNELSKFVAKGDLTDDAIDQFIFEINTQLKKYNCRISVLEPETNFGYQDDRFNSYQIYLNKNEGGQCLTQPQGSNERYTFTDEYKGAKTRLSIMRQESVESLSNRSYLVVINSNLSKVAKLVVLAHELGHVSEMRNPLKLFKFNDRSTGEAVFAKPITEAFSSVYALTACMMLQLVCEAEDVANLGKMADREMAKFNRVFGKTE